LPSFQQQVDTLARWRELPGLERVPGAGRRAVLTFDDGPDADWTPAVLDALDAAGARATFFLVGEQLMANIGLGAEIRRRGHEIALHGYEHRDHDELRPFEARDDPARALGTLEAGTGARPRFYRPPYGRFSGVSYEACGALGLEPVYWSAWGCDWEAIGPERIAHLVNRDLSPGSVVLLHDSARYAERDSAAATVQAIPLIVERAKELELELVPLGEAVDAAEVVQ
jgi:peptidoglycan-N-acetylglucosamine deacetylase